MYYTTKWKGSSLGFPRAIIDFQGFSLVVSSLVLARAVESARAGEKTNRAEKQQLRELGPDIEASCLIISNGVCTYRLLLLMI